MKRWNTRGESLGIARNRIANMGEFDRVCEICGTILPTKPGVPAKTCSPACRAERHRRLERARYHAIKHSERFKETRAQYLQQLKKKLEKDPELAAIVRAYRRAQTAAWKERVDQDPERRAALLAQKRAHYARWRQDLTQDPLAWEEHKAKARAWYASLTPEERERIYYAPRRKGNGDT